MVMQISKTADTTPISRGQELQPLERHPEPPASPLTKIDRFVGTANQTATRSPIVLRPVLPLGIAGAATGQVEAVAPTLDATFETMRAAGGGSAKARLLSTNLDAWNARWEMLNRATTSIDASYFSLEKDVFGYAFLGALLKKQMDGVPVRVMTDAMADTFGQRGFKMALRGRDYLQEIVNHGGQAYIYNPIASRPGRVLNGDYSPLSSNHDKVLVVDGQRGITGGRNIGIDYFAEAVDRPGAWRDMDIELDGAGAAKGLKVAFDAELGDGDVARPVSKDRFGNLSKKDIQLLGAYEMMNLWLNDPALSQPQKSALRADPAARQALAAELVKRAIAKVDASLPHDLRRQPNRGDLEKLTELAEQLVDQLEARGSRQTYLTQRLPVRATEVKILDQTSAAAANVSNGIAPALKKLVDSATRKIVIQNPYVVLTEEMLKGLEQASQRGVKIDIITNSPLSTDSAVTQAFFLEDWAAILARCPNARIFVATGDRKFHAKSAVIDDEQSFVSTYNLDLLSGKVNSEVGAVVKSKELAADLLKEFDTDLADPSNGFLEYTIKKDANGQAILKDGKPIPVFGPEDHLPAAVLDDYRGRRKLWGQTLRNAVPYLKPLRHPERIGSH